MAKGWESKSVEEQQAEFASARLGLKPVLTPAQIERVQHEQGLKLARKRILTQLEGSHNSNYTKVLQDALADLDAKILRIS